MEVRGCCYNVVERFKGVWLQCCSMERSTKANIEAGDELTLVYAPSGNRREDQTMTVEATSDLWVNSKGIEGFHAEVLESSGSRDAGDKPVVQTHLWEVA